MAKPASDAVMEREYSNEFLGRVGMSADEMDRVYDLSETISGILQMDYEITQGRDFILDKIGRMTDDELAAIRRFVKLNATDECKFPI